MDTITHGLITRLFAKAVVSNPHERGLVWIATFCSVLPDVDLLFDAGDPLAVLHNHRGFTHSLLGAILLGFPVAVLAHRGDPRALWERWRTRPTVPQAANGPVRDPHASSGPRRDPTVGVGDPSEGALGEVTPGFWAFYLASVLGIGSHIFFDLVTSYGTMVLRPFSDRRFSLDLWFILDPYVWLILGVPWFIRRVSGCGPRKRGWEYRVGAMLLVGYLLLAAGVQVTALRRLEAWATEQGIPAVTIGAIPVAFSPLHRKGIIMAPDRVYEIPVRVASADVGPSVVHPSPFRSGDPFIMRAWATPEGKRYRGFARFPLATRQEAGKRQRVILSDLRFQGRWEELDAVGRAVARILLWRWPDLMDRKRQALEVIFDAEGRIESVRFLP